MATSTPWGLSKTSKKYAPGINWYETDKNSGFHVSAKKLNRMPQCLRELGGYAGWFSKGGPDAAVIIAFPQYFALGRIGRAHQLLREQYPEVYKKLQEPFETA